MLEHLHIGSDLDGLNVFVFGAGVSGRAAALLAASRQARVYLFDEQDSTSLQAHLQPLQAAGITCLTGSEAGCGLKTPCHLAVVSPGIRQKTLLGEQLSKLSAPILSELSFGALYCRRPMLAVTGTNGKTTTVEMLTHCLRQAGYAAEACGNIGLPLSAVALRSTLPEWLVVEVSSFQLEHAEGFMPYASALLNVTPDHLDRHGSLAVYLQEKLKLLRQSQREHPVVVRAELMENQAVAAALRQRQVLTFSAGGGIHADYGLQDGRIVRHRPGGGALAVEQLPFSGRHNLENAMVALALAEVAGVSFAVAAAGLSTFTTGHHRLEQVCEHRQVRYINDSKSTNVDALIQALQAVGSPGRRNIVLIAGGIDKGCDLSEACEYLRWYVRGVLLIGQCRERLLASWGQVVPAVLCDSLEEACAEAVRTAAAGDVVLLSPACASQDMFKDYAHRGQVFSEWVNKECER